MISVIFTIPTSQFTELNEEGEQVKKLSNSYILNTVKTRSLCEAMAETVEEIKKIYYSDDIIGAWKESGLQVGLEYETNIIGKDEEGNELTEQGIIGESEYPFNEAKYLEYMKDIVEYDEEGIELSRTRPIEPRFILNWGGWGEKVI